MARMLLAGWMILFSLVALRGAELNFDFGKFQENQTPPGFRSTVSGLGKPGRWQVIEEAAPSALPAFSPKAPVTSRQSVVAQLDQDPTDEHFPMLIYEGETFDDFTLTTKFKTVKGDKEQMAGIAFRIQNETNYYVVRASSRGNTFRFYKVVNGERGNIIGPEVSIPANVWHELRIECKGTEIKCQLNGKELIPTLTDTSFTKGKIGFWTKSDSVSYFTDTKINFKHMELPAQSLVTETIKKYGRILSLKMFIKDADAKGPRIIASSDAKTLGETGGKAEETVLAAGSVFYGKGNGTVIMTMPLRDRNGDPVIAVQITLKSFPGETEQSALNRATPVIREMQTHFQSLDDLVR